MREVEGHVYHAATCGVSIAKVRFRSSWVQDIQGALRHVDNNGLVVIQRIDCTPQKGGRAGCGPDHCLSLRAVEHYRVGGQEPKRITEADGVAAGIAVQVDAPG